MKKAEKNTKKEELKNQDKTQQTASTEQPTPEEQVHTLNQKIEDLEKNLADEKDKYVRLYAEFINYQNRTKREKSELIETASEEVLKALLPVVDDFERAMNEMRKAGENEWLKGVQLIYDKFLKTLKDQGLETIEVKKGDEFNPDLHEAVAQIPGDKKMSGKIHDVIEKGYKLGGKIIRYPKVVTVQ